MAICSAWPFLVKPLFIRAFWEGAPGGHLAPEPGVHVRCQVAGHGPGHWSDQAHDSPVQCPGSSSHSELIRGTCYPSVPASHTGASSDCGQLNDVNTENSGLRVSGDTNSDESWWQWLGPRLLWAGCRDQRRGLRPPWPLSAQLWASVAGAAQIINTERLFKL